MMRVNSILLLPLIFLPLISAVSGGLKGTQLGGWTPIKNIKDPHVTEIANFAVTEYDKKSGSKLSLKEVIKGETQVVAGTNYRLVLAANDGNKVSNFIATVWEQPWLHNRNLTAFEPYRG